MYTPEMLCQESTQSSNLTADSIQIINIQETAKNGDAEAAFQWALTILKQPQPDYLAALPWLELATQQNHTYAHYYLLQSKENIDTPFTHHLQQYAWLGEHGILEAQKHLLEYYRHYQDPQALYWAIQVAPHHASGDYFLARHYHLSNQFDLEKSRHFYHKAAEKNLPVAHWQLGQIYYKGIGITPDLTQAVHHLQIAAQHGFISAKTLLGDILAIQNNPDALVWYKKAADQNDNNAQTALARHYLTDQLTNRDPTLAIKYAQLAASHHHPEALKLMGDIYCYGLGVKADIQTAHHYYHQAAKSGNLAAYQKLLSDAALQDNLTNYHIIQSAALECQKVTKTYQMAQAYHQGIGKKIDYKLARKLYLSIAEYQHKEAATGLGLIYFHGQGVQTHYPNAAYWFEIAAQNGEATAQYYLAKMYYYGQGVVFNPEMACYWLQVAINNGYENPEAHCSLLKQWQNSAPHRLITSSKSQKNN